MYKISIFFAFLFVSCIPNLSALGNSNILGDNEESLSEENNFGIDNNNLNILGKRKKAECVNDETEPQKKIKKFELLEEIIQIPEKIKNYSDLKGINPIFTKEFYLQQFLSNKFVYPTIIEALQQPKYSEKLEQILFLLKKSAPEEHAKKAISILKNHISNLLMEKYNVIQNENFIALKDFILNSDIEFTDNETDYTSFDSNVISAIFKLLLNFNYEEQKEIIYFFKSLHKYNDVKEAYQIQYALRLFDQFKSLGIPINSSIGFIDLFFEFGGEIGTLHDECDLNFFPIYLFDLNSFRKVLAQHYNAERIFKDAKDEYCKTEYFIYHLLVHLSQQQCRNEYLKIQNVHTSDILLIFRAFYKELFLEDWDAGKRAIELAADLAYNDNSFFENLYKNLGENRKNELKKKFFKFICSKCQKNEECFKIKQLNISDTILLDSIEYGIKNKINNITPHRQYFISFLFEKMLSDNINFSEKAKFLIIKIWLNEIESYTYVQTSKMDDLKTSLMNVLSLFPKNSNLNIKNLKMNFKWLALLPIERFDIKKCAKILNRADIQQKIANNDLSIFPRLIAESCTDSVYSIFKPKLSKRFVSGSNQTFSDYLREFIITKCNLIDCDDLIPYFYEDKYVRLLSEVLEEEDEILSYDISEFMDFDNKSRTVIVINRIYQIKKIWHAVNLDDSFLKIFMSLLKKYYIFYGQCDKYTIDRVYKDFVQKNDYKYFDNLKKSKIHKDILKFIGMVCCLIDCKDDNDNPNNPIRLAIAFQEKKLNPDSVLELFNYLIKKGKIKNDDLMFLNELIMQCGLNHRFHEKSYSAIFKNDNTKYRKTIVSLLMYDSIERSSFMKILSKNERLAFQQKSNYPFIERSFLHYIAKHRKNENENLPIDAIVRIIEAFEHTAYGDYFQPLANLYQDGNYLYNDRWNENDIFQPIFTALADKNVFDINIKNLIHNYFYIFLETPHIYDGWYDFSLNKLNEMSAFLIEFLLEIDKYDDENKKYILKILKKYIHYIVCNLTIEEYYTIRWNLNAGDGEHDLKDFFKKIVSDIKLILSLDKPVSCSNLSNWKTYFSSDMNIKNLLEIFTKTEIVPENFDILQQTITDILYGLKDAIE